MKRLFWIIAVMSLAITACNHKDKGNKTSDSEAAAGSSSAESQGMVTTTVSGRFVGSGVNSITLVSITDDFNQSQEIGSHELTANGDFKFEFKIEKGASPRYYCIETEGEDLHLPLIIAPGDNIVLRSAGDIGLNYEVEGSEESQLLREFHNSYFDYYNKYTKKLEFGEWRAATEIAMTALRMQIEFVVKNADKLAAIYASQLDLFERELPDLASNGVNYMHLEGIRQALAKSYPSSPYIAILEQQIEIAKMIDNAPEALYPDISLTDINRVRHNLSDLRGKVTLLCFWSSQDSMSNIFVSQFKELYNRYHDAGLEAYFVSADMDRITWIDMVQKQQHPWASVFGGDNPKVFDVYNIQVVPYAYIIDRDGNVSYAPLNTAELERVIKELL